ncbi:hypothetical protein SAMN05661010_01120 [Modicisalibacter muralis]|uniref:Uncharacterized protein n=1 Tax=Modicisalibacter muralis TaxID=119000 RepID=A0A1G9IB46_9GAMM|nr:hypothetical protein [Halomonas muralis]SDL22429.1 hypothetical protein SAMN05661010_01120 [Halomonas muralis]
MNGFVRVPGEVVKGNSLGSFYWNADLINFEGPLLSLFKNDEDEDFLFVWLDCNNTKNRWCMVAVDRDQLKGYLGSVLPLRNIMADSSELIVFSVSRAGRRSAFIRTDFSHLPEEYRPEKDSFLTDDIATNAAVALREDSPQDYYLGLDGDLYIDDIQRIPQLYKQLYSFHYGLEHLKRSAVRHKLGRLMGSWGGGFSAVNIFTGLRNVIPSIHRARLQELRYNSPGHIKLNLLPRMAKSIEKSSDIIVDEVKFQEMESFYRSVYRFFDQNRISGFEKESGSISEKLTADTKEALSVFVDTFFELMDWKGFRQQFDSIESNPLRQLRVLLAYYRRLRELRSYVIKGKLDIGKSKLDRS